MTTTPNMMFHLVLPYLQVGSPQIENPHLALVVRVHSCSLPGSLTVLWRWRPYSSWLTRPDSKLFRTLLSHQVQNLWFVALCFDCLLAFRPWMADSWALFHSPQTFLVDCALQRVIILTSVWFEGSFHHLGRPGGLFPCFEPWVVPHRSRGPGFWAWSSHSLSRGSIVPWCLVPELPRGSFLWLAHPPKPKHPTISPHAGLVVHYQWK